MTLSVRPPRTPVPAPVSLTILRIVNEPTAAAIACGLDKKNPVVPTVTTTLPPERSLQISFNHPSPRLALYWHTLGRLDLANDRNERHGRPSNQVQFIVMGGPHIRNRFPFMTLASPSLNVEPDIT
ncbi:hypothetical protein FS837_000931 [Tulasnella sp. UAMH 9824]|nr:hypothetical protein FS837_000931 [Tulasnella sp. UAMH 9824]